MNKKIIFYLILTGLFTTIVSAQTDPCIFLTEEERGTLLTGDYIYDSNGPMGLPRYIPDHEFTQKILQDLESTHHSVVTEILFYVSRPDEIKTEQDILDLLNPLLQVSDQGGIEYFSQRKQQMLTLIDESYVVADSRGKKAIADPIFTSLPEYYRFYVYQKDWIFGGNTFQYDIYSSSNGLLMEVTNTQAMRVFGMVKAFNQEELLIRFVMVPYEKGFYLYGVAYIEEVKSIVENSVDIGSSFRKRIAAIMSWYKEKL